MVSGINKPNFLIVGAAKAGSTSLAKYLNDHPRVFIPERKELRYFVSRIISNVNKRDPLLKGILNQSILSKKAYYEAFNNDILFKGDASIHYLYHYKEAIPRIKEELGDIPIIILLRSPVFRAISNWKFNKVDYRLFSEALEDENRLIKENFNSFWYYKELGFYSKQVQAYMDNFSTVKILIFEEFIKNPEYFVNNIIENVFHLHNEKVSIQYKQYNKSEALIPKSGILRKIFRFQIQNKVIGTTLTKVMPKNLLLDKDYFIEDFHVKMLQDLYREDVHELERIIKRDLGFWLTT